MKHTVKVIPKEEILANRSNAYKFIDFDKDMKQTAVEWLLDRIEDVDLTEKLWENVKQQAKEMEKQQIFDAWDNGYDKGFGYSDAKFNSSEQYYNETFKKK